MYQELDPAVQQHLSLESFEGKFDVKEFVAGISERLISQSKASSGPFDPKPFIRTLEAAVDQLITQRKDVQARTEQMEKSVKVAEREYSKKMAELNRGFEAVGQSFGGMESKMNEVGRTAIRIGEELESVHHQRQRAQAAYDLIDFYNQFSRDDNARLDALKKEGKEGRRQVAVLLRRLGTVAKEVDLPNADKIQQQLEQLVSRGTSLSDLAFLRILQMVHQQTSLLVEDLKSYELPSIIPRSPVDRTDFNQSLNAAASGAVAATTTAVTISAMLETAMEELFVPYTEGQRYLERESKSLIPYIFPQSLLMTFQRQERTHKGGKSSLFDRMVNQLSTAAAGGSAGGASTTSAQAAAAILRYGGLSASAERNKEKANEEPVREEDGQLHIAIAEIMLKWHAEAVGRCVELSSSSDV
ncbi:hypothetical protein EW026_g3392 [Hermanssonia centrifuga]|uniref:Uncharacterized protein n=1 Tax=Hermanssonia centrifuga TaxID=98765 RepID=A0A4S4KMA8_9APHY|nr:hypothetical protein EW026_g3392 [Hermanssonia centrifuga]